MIRKILISLFCCVVAFLSSYADDIEMELNQGDTIQKEIGDYILISMYIKNVDENDNVTVSAKLKNKGDDTSQVLCLFCENHNEKALKTLRIRFDNKKIGGKKGNRSTANCPHIKSYVIIERSKEEIVEISGKPTDTIECTLPIYKAYRKKSGSKIYLQEFFDIKLKINVKLKPDSDFVNIQSEYEELQKSIGEECFCTNRYHAGTPFKTLKEKYENRIKDLKQKIDSIRGARHLISSDSGYKKFGKIYEGLDSISIDSLKVSQCEHDNKKPAAGKSHHCKYCNERYEGILNKMNQHYRDISNGDKKKEQVIGDVKALYNCYNNFKNRPPAKNSATKYNIVKVYKEIMGMK